MFVYGQRMKAGPLNERVWNFAHSVHAEMKRSDRYQLVCLIAILQCVMTKLCTNLTKWRWNFFLVTHSLMLWLICNVNTWLVHLLRRGLLALWHWAITISENNFVWMFVRQSIVHTLVLSLRFAHSPQAFVYLSGHFHSTISCSSLHAISKHSNEIFWAFVV